VQPAVPLSVLGLALLGIDVLLMGLDALVMRNAVVVDCGLCFPDGSLISCSSIVGVQAAAAAAATASSDKFATSAAVAAGPAPPAASPSGLPLPPAARRTHCITLCPCRRCLPVHCGSSLSPLLAAGGRCWRRVETAASGAGMWGR